MSAEARLFAARPWFIVCESDVNESLDVLFVIPQGLPDIACHHEATSGMGAILPLVRDSLSQSKPFLYPPHLGATCVSVAQNAGLKADLVDPFAEQLSLGESLARVVEARPRVLALLTSQGSAHADENWLRLWHSHGAGGRERPKVLLFGPSAHFHAQPWLTEGLADAALVGEPEGAIAEALQGLIAGRLTGVVPCAALAPQAYDPSGLLTDLDRLPYPAWDRVRWHPYEMLTLLSSRGCPAGCHFCAYTVVQGHRTRFTAVERTLAEWTWLSEQIRPPYVMVRDPVFAASRARVEALCEGIVGRGLRVPWACESRPEHFDHELLRLMKAAGCVMIRVGLESGDPQLLVRIGRADDLPAAQDYLAQARRVASSCDALGIRCRVFVMAGLPGESANSMTETLVALRALSSATLIHARPYQPHPGTALAEPSSPISPEVLAQLEMANQPQAPPWRRALRVAHSGAAALAWRISSWGQQRGAELPGDTPRASTIFPAEPGEPDLCLAGQRAFLTGGNGFLGGHVARVLANAGVQVIALVRAGSSLGALADLPVEIVRGELQNPQGWLRALAGCSLCFHLAALYARAATEGSAAAMYALNVNATSALLAACACAGVRRVVHTSTVGTVGRPASLRELPDETLPFNLWDRASPYVKSKYLGELVARSWAATGLEVIVVKPTAPVGAGDARPTATGSRILAALRGEVAPYPPGGINHVPATDVAAGHFLAACRGVPGQTYILGHRDGNLGQEEFLRLIAEVAHTNPLRPPGEASHFAGAGAVANWLRHAAKRSLALRRHSYVSYLPSALTADPKKAIRELGMPQTSLRAAFSEAVNWYRSHPREADHVAAG